MPILKKLKQHKILLDTHVWIWLMTGDDRLGKSFRKTIMEDTDKELILVSAISVWELGMLVEKKRIELEMDCLDWAMQALKTPGINLVPLTPSIAVLSTRLPQNPHGDPADRILIASAYENHAVLVTHDQKLIDFGKSKFINVHDPCS